MHYFQLSSSSEITRFKSLWMYVVNVMLLHREIGHVYMHKRFSEQICCLFTSLLSHVPRTPLVFPKYLRGPMYSALQFTPTLSCNSRGRLWLAFPSWAHLKFPGLGTDNKGAVTLWTSAAKYSPRVLERFAQSAEKYLLSAPALDSWRWLKCAYRSCNHSSGSC